MLRDPGFSGGPVHAERTLQQDPDGQQGNQYGSDFSHDAVRNVPSAPSRISDFM